MKGSGGGVWAAVVSAALILGGLQGTRAAAREEVLPSDCGKLEINYGELMTILFESKKQKKTVQSIKTEKCGQVPVTPQIEKYVSDNFQTLKAEIEARNPPINVQDLYSNRTIRTYDDQHGNQVEFNATDGKLYLWYPGSQRVLPGEWKLQAFDVCTKYPSGSYNPVTKTRGGDWECGAVGSLAAHLREHQPGDLFGLSKAGKVPWILEAHPETSLQKILDKQEAQAREGGLEKN